jgi:hypothetical protein
VVRCNQPNVVLVHYADLTNDLDEEIRRLAQRLAIPPPRSWAEVVGAASLEQMRQRADLLAPDRGGVLKSRAAFFRAGGLGTATRLLDDDDLAAYLSRVEALAPRDLLEWLHR